MKNSNLPAPSDDVESHRPGATFEEHDPLSFRELRAANLARLPLFRDRHGNLAHSQPDGSDWSETEWLQAVMGELGELANLVEADVRLEIESSRNPDSHAWTCLCDAEDDMWWLARRTPDGWSGPWSVVIEANLCLFDQTREYLPDWLSTSPSVVPTLALLELSSDFYVLPRRLPSLPSF